MPTTQTYYDQLILNSNAAAAAKKTALDQAYERMTTATFDDSGQISYKKDDKGNPLYGSMDVDYMNRTRQTGAGAESSGMLRSGQYTRSLAEGQAAYRSGIVGAKSQTEAQKTQIDEELAQKQAEYKAMYGTVGGSSGGGSSGGGSSGGGSSAGTGAGTGLPPVTTAPGIGGTSTTKTPTAPTTNLTPSQQKGLATRNTVKGGFGATKSPQAAAGPAKSPTQVTTPKPTPQPRPVTTKPGQRVIRPGQVR